MSALPTSAPLRAPGRSRPGEVIPFPGEQPVPLVDDPTGVTVGWSLATEDYDTTPVPVGCPDCWLRGGGRCMACPDKGKPMVRPVVSP